MPEPSGAWSPTGPRVAEVGEEHLLERIAAWRRVSERIPVGMGDDAAVLCLRPDAEIVLSVDALLEGQHFRRGWIDPEPLGHRAVRVAASDLAAMGAIPRWLLLSMELPAELPLPAFEALMAGVAGGAASDGLVLVGGNLSRGTALNLHMTVLGEPARTGHTLRRDGARPGQEIFLTGNPGHAAAGRAFLGGDDASAMERFADLVESWRRPPARWAIAAELATPERCTAAIDLSDGLLVDARRLAEASGVGLVINLDELLDDRLAAAARALGADPRPWVVGGGDDYELLLCGHSAPGLKSIGQVVDGAPGVRLLLGDAPFDPKDLAAGWDPFTGRDPGGRDPGG